MNKEAYERPALDVIEFNTEDVIATSGEAPVGFNPDNPWEMPNKP